MTDAIVLAGGGTERGLGADIPNKGSLQISGGPLVDYVVQAVQRARGIGRIAVVGPPGPLRSVLSHDVTIVSDNGGIMENVAHAVRELGGRDLTLVAASDIPLLTGAVVEEFLAVCARTPADFYYAVVPKDAMDRQFPTAQKTYVTMTEGTFCGGSPVQVNPAGIYPGEAVLGRGFAARQEPPALAPPLRWGGG